MIRATGISKRLRSAEGAVSRILDNVTLEVPRGCLYGLIGPAAAGKTTLLKVLSGLLSSDTGTVQIDDFDVSSASDIALRTVRARIGMLFQNSALFDHMTVFENVAFPLRRRGGVSEQGVRDRVLERLECVSLEGFADRSPVGLSGGQKKRVAVARATVTNPPYVLYDEPAAGLDPVTSQKIFDLLRNEQKAHGATVVMVSSDLDRLLPLTDRVLMLNAGRVVFDGATLDIWGCDDPVVHQFVRGDANGPL